MLSVFHVSKPVLYCVCFPGKVPDGVINQYVVNLSVCFPIRTGPSRIIYGSRNACPWFRRHLFMEIILRPMHISCSAFPIHGSVFCSGIHADDFHDFGRFFLDCLVDRWHLCTIGIDGFLGFFDGLFNLSPMIVPSFVTIISYMWSVCC